MWFIGDVHGHFDTYEYITTRMQVPTGGTMGCSFQLGDTGIFTREDLDACPSNEGHCLLRGNHDNPALHHKHALSLPDYGYAPDSGLFWTAGAWSIDQAYRTIGVNWWPLEELTYEDMTLAIAAYREARPTVMCSHDGPEEAIRDLMESRGEYRHHRTRTAFGLQCMLDSHRPDVWVFAHHHHRFEKVIHGTRFIALDHIHGISPKSGLFEIPEIGPFI